MRQKRGISPVIATVLLVGMVTISGLIIFAWFKSLTQEAVTKFGGQNIELVCNDVDFSAEYTNDILTISNIGNVPLYSFKVKITNSGNFETKDIKEIPGEWPSVGIKQGATYVSEDLSNEFFGADEVLLIPVLVGTSDSGEQSHVCAESNGKEVFLG